jgi:hypothetical protein
MAPPWERPSSHGEIRLAAINDNTNMLEDWDIATS